MDLEHELDLALEELMALARSQPGVTAEYRGSATEFFGRSALPDPGASESARQELQRHLEWFLLERHCTALDGVPVERLRERWIESNGNDAADTRVEDALLGSLCGIFEVTGVEAAQGLWVRDLLGGGEYPLVEPEAASELSLGDMLVGRVFPLGEAGYRASRAVACFRNEALLKAVHGDMEALRAARRGSLRISQVELERMFHGADTPAPDPRATRANAERLLIRGGVDADEARELVSELLQVPYDQEQLTPGVGDELAELLERLAFETEVDLEAARRALVEAWSVAGDSPPAARSHGAPTGDASVLTPMPPPSNGARKASDAREALEAFDRARAEGENLEVLFDQLERDLGLAGEGSGDAGQVPDFPGVVGAVVEEFLWEASQRDGAEASESLQPVRAFADYGRDIGVFDNVTARDVLTFVTVWVLEERRVRTGDEARALLTATAAFCRWCEEEQDVPLWSGFGAAYDGLCASLPRAVEANAALEFERGAEEEIFVVDAPAPASPPSVMRLDDDGATLVLSDGPWCGLLVAGDLVRGQARDGRVHVHACYPAEARAVFEERSDALSDPASRESEPRS